jgi:hypothetical protein
MVMPDGFAWNGRIFGSLSQVAFAITGTKWNGPSLPSASGTRLQPPSAKDCGSVAPSFLAMS